MRGALLSVFLVEHCELFVFSFASIFITKPNYEFVYRLFALLKLETREVYSHV